MQFACKKKKVLRLLGMSKEQPNKLLAAIWPQVFFLNYSTTWTNKCHRNLFTKSNLQL